MEKKSEKKIDALIVQNKNVIAVIEYKNTSQFKTKAQKTKAIKQELEVAKKLSAHIIIATDTKETIWVNVLTGKKIIDEDGKELKTNFDPKDKKLPQLIEKIIASINEKNNQIKPKELVNPTDLAKSIWQDIWSVSGATPENCLYTFVELFIFKYLSDLNILPEGINFDHLQDRFNYKSPKSDEKALEFYAGTIRPEIKKLFPEGNDGTTIINGTIFVSKAQKAVTGYSTVFKKVLLKFKNYGRLEYIDYDFKSQLFESFLKESISKKNWGQFFTPIKVIRAIVAMAKDEIKVGAKICDPACGVGKFLLEPILTKLDQFYEVKKGKLISKITIKGFDKGFDKDEQKTIILAKANMLIYFSELIKENPTLTTKFSDLFNETFELKTNSILGTLDEATENEYDLILTNPPYVTSGSSNLKEEISKDGELKNYYKINAIGVEGLFMEWIIRALKPNGKAFVVVPDGIFNRQNDKNLRQFIIDECFIDGIISLPTKTFFTTPKKTYILAITKKANKKDIQTNPVFTYLTSEIGESRDIYRFDIEQDDLSEAVKLFSFFKGNKSNFKEFNTDKRCKIQFFNKFKPENHWSIDRWWTKDEKIDLGILEKDKTIKFEELPYLLDDVANNILSFKEEILALNEKKKPNLKFKEERVSEILTSPPTNSGLKKIHVSLKKTKTHSIPVYSASKNENQVFGYVTEDSKWKKYKKTLTWNKDGSANFVFYRKNKFVPYEKVKVLKLKETYSTVFLYEYLKIVIQESMVKEGFNFNHKCSMDRVLKLSIPIPYNQGKIDIKKQKEVIEKYEYISELKSKILVYKKQIKDLNVEINNNLNVKLLSIINLFTIISGNSKLTKNYLNANKGKYVVYSANTKQNGVFGYINSFDHNVECIQITTNGVYAGTVFYREKHKFSLNGDARLLIKNDENLDYVYLLTELKKVFNQYNFNWENKPTVAKIKPIKISIPINKKGEFDLKVQKEIAKKYKIITQIKKNISEELDKITNIEINFE